jgi:phosphatidylglycerol---prolipoprotein diacylglyceryl transferase
MHYFHDINPIAFSLGPVSVHWYGLMYLAAFVIAFYLGKHRLAQHRLPITTDQFSDLLFNGMLGVILGGRLGYVFFYSFSDFLANPLMIFRIWEGGMSFHGGLIGVLVSSWWWSRQLKIKFWDTMDFVSPIVPIGLGMGRVGNFVGGELWGRVSDVSWAMIFPKAVESAQGTVEELKALAAQGLLEHEARHPSQLYQVLIEGVILFLIVWMFSAKPRARYAVSGVFALTYGLGRFIVEFWREPDSQLGFLAFDWVTMGQLLSLPLILLGMVLLWLSRRAPIVYPLKNQTAAVV